MARAGEKSNSSGSSATWIGSTARKRELDVRREVEAFRRLREQRGSLTLAQLRVTSRLIAQHAEALYRRADCVERGELAPGIPAAASLPALALRVDRAGHPRDPVTRSVLDRLKKLAPAGAEQPATPGEIRAVAAELVRLSRAVADAPRLPGWRPPRRPRGGRRPDASLDRLLRAAAKFRIPDAELARELARQRVRSAGHGSVPEESLLARRWAAILRSARARRARRTEPEPRFRK